MNVKWNMAIAVLATMASMLLVDAVHSMPADGPENSAYAKRPVEMKQTVQDREGRTLYYVEFEGQPGILASASSGTKAKAKDIVASKAVQSRRAEIRKRQDSLLERLVEKAGREFKAVTRHDLLLNGISAYLGADEAERLQQVEGVQRIMAISPRYPETDRGPGFIGAPVVWNGEDGGASTSGEGIVVGIVDSGIDPTHPSFADVGDDGYDHVNPLGEGTYLGDCESAEYRHLCNDKLIGIVSYSEITDLYAPLRDPVGIDYIGHGTHVASTAAGNVLHDVPAYEAITGSDTGFTFNFVSGVAPHANIVSYQVCMPPQDGNGNDIEYGPCLTNLAVEAVEHAIENGVDVINYSIGGGPNDPWLAMDAQAYLNAREAGIHVATSAGNSGPFPETVGSPANAPWINSVAASTHDRAYSTKQLLNFSGGDLAPPATITGKGITFGIEAPIVYAGDYGDAFCNAAFAEDTFRGETVVCLRGEIARVMKGKNVLDGGAGGLVLVNVEGGDGGLVDDFHVLPAIHIDVHDGIELIDWLSSGTGHRAEISTSASFPDPAVADIVTGFSSRGPNVPIPDIPALHIAAPGSNIYAAMITDQPFHDVPDAVAPFAFQSGTSMASPHVAGALALVLARNPEWSPAETQSAIMLTAEPGMLQTVIDASGNIVDIPADLHSEGSGSLRVSRAVNAGLVMPITHEEYVAANPAEGGDTATLNMPVLMEDGCLAVCSWTRTFKASYAATWTVEFDTDSPDMTMTADPSTFSVAAGDIVDITITAEVTATDVTIPHTGRMRLVSSNRDHPVLQLPVEAYVKPGITPESVSVTAHRDNDLLTIPGVRTIGFDQLFTSVAGLVDGERLEAWTEGDPTPEQYADDFERPWHIVPLAIPKETPRIVAKILEADAPDLDLFIAPDNNGNGRLDMLEIGITLEGYEGTCFSAGEDSDEACSVADPHASTYFVAIHNYTGSDAVEDRHVVQIVVVDPVNAENLQLLDTGSKAANESFDIQGIYDIDAEEGEVMYGLVSFGLSEKDSGSIGSTIVEIVRGEDDVSLVVPEAASAESGSITVQVRRNDSAVPRTYSLSLSAVSDGILVPRDFTTDDSAGSHVWQYEHPVGAPPRDFMFDIDNGNVSSEQEYALTLTHGVNVEGISLAAESTSATIVVAPPPSKKSGGGAAFWLIGLLYLMRRRIGWN